MTGQPRLKSGDLDRFISIEADAPTRSATGAVNPAWSALASVWAKYRPKHGREFMAGGVEITAEADAVFTIRWRADVTTGQRIQFDGKVWDILSVVEYGRRVGLELVAKSRGVE